VECSSSPSSLGYKEKVMTAEAIQKAALKSQKRKQLADEKREKDKVVMTCTGLKWTVHSLH
jgi:hypothetical protein